MGTALGESCERPRADVNNVLGGVGLDIEDWGPPLPKGTWKTTVERMHWSIVLQSSRGKSPYSAWKCLRRGLSRPQPCTNTVWFEDVFSS